jgi:hypothetical protein
MLALYEMFLASLLNQMGTSDYNMRIRELHTGSRYLASGLEHRVDLKVDPNVPEEHTASIFKA